MRLLIFLAALALFTVAGPAFAQRPCPNGKCPAPQFPAANPVPVQYLVETPPQPMPGPGPVVFVPAAESANCSAAAACKRQGLFQRLRDRREQAAERGHCRGR